MASVAAKALTSPYHAEVEAGDVTGAHAHTVLQTRGAPRQDTISEPMMHTHGTPILEHRAFEPHATPSTRHAAQDPLQAHKPPDWPALTGRPCKQSSARPDPFHLASLSGSQRHLVNALTKWLLNCSCISLHNRAAGSMIPRQTSKSSFQLPMSSSFIWLQNKHRILQAVTFQRSYIIRSHPNA